MEIIAKKEAVERGLKRYFTGAPCNKGHVVERSVSKGECLECLSDRQRKWADRNRSSENERGRIWYANNKERAKVTRSNWRDKNSEKVRADVANYQLANKEKLRIAKAIWQKNNIEKRNNYSAGFRVKYPDRVRKTQKNWRTANPDKVNAAKAERIARLLRATPQWANLQSIRKIYKAASQLKKSNGVEYHVDHIVPLKSKLVCGLHCEANLRVIPGSENQAKSNRHWPDMP